MRSALEILAGKPPKEQGGQRANNRFGYQKDWTFCLLLRLHQTHGDYLVVCDYHDDVLVMEDSQTPSEIHFYQVKTNVTKRWTITDLLAQKDGKTGRLPSMLGKLYSHRLEFDEVTGTLNFVANLPINVELPSTPSAENRDYFGIDELAPKDITRIAKSLRKELALNGDPVLDAAIVFHVGGLSVQSHEDTTVGKLATYLENRDSSRGYPVSAIYRTIASEIERRSSVERPCTSVVDIKQLKAISRSDFEGFLTRCIKDAERRDYDKVARDFEAELRSAEVDFVRRRSLVQILRTYAIERTDDQRRDLRQCAAEAGAFVGKHFTGSSSFVQLLEQGALELERAKWGVNFDRDYLTAIVAWEVLTYEG